MATAATTRRGGKGRKAQGRAKERGRTVELLAPRRLKVDVDALDVALHLAAEQAVDGAVGLGALHLGLELVAQDAVELLHVVLQERVEALPAERLGELGRACGSDAGSGSEMPQGTSGARRGRKATHRPTSPRSGGCRRRVAGRAAPCRSCRPLSGSGTRPVRERVCVSLGVKGIEGERTHFSELVGEEERLEERVHVARRALVLEPDVSSHLLRVVAASVDEPRQDR